MIILIKMCKLDLYLTLNPILQCYGTGFDAEGVGSRVQ